MLKIPTHIIDSVKNASEAEHLKEHLQAAIELEHATIPPYLTALYSIKSGYNQQAYGIILSVVIEEMLHMTISANVLNAIGGEPAIDNPDFVPAYPGPLPMNVGDGLIVGLAPLSKDILENTFMKIEEPDDPINFPVKALAAVPEEQEYSTIADFYNAIIAKITELGDSIFTGDQSKQVTTPMFSSKELFPVKDVKSATAAINIIIEQGEGTSKSPLDPEGRLAHFYRFAEIFHGKKLIEDDTVPQGYSYSGEVIEMDAEGIWDLLENPTSSSYPEGSMARQMSDQFNYSYSNLLRALHKTFNGYPENIKTAMGLMYELKLQAQNMVERKVPGSDKHVAPAFQFTTVNL